MLAGPIRFGLVALAFLGNAASASATTLLVPDDYPTIQAAIDAAVIGDRVLVAPGIYDTPLTRSVPGFGDFESVVFLKAGVDVVSSHGPQETFIDKVERYAGRSTYAVAGFNLHGAAILVEGFTIRARGFGNTATRIESSTASVTLHFRNVVFDVPEDVRALTARSTHLVVEQCTFRGFFQPTAGAFTYESIAGAVRSLTVRNSLFEGGVGSGLRVVTDGFGGAVVQLAVENCLFRGLTSTYQGAIMLNGRMDGHISGCRFDSTAAVPNFGGSAGGIYAVQTSTSFPLRLEANIFFRTTTDALGGSGAISCFGRTCEIIGNTIVDCSAPNGDAGAIEVRSPSAAANQLRQNVIAYCDGPSGAVFAVGPTLSDCNVFWENEGGNGTGFEFGSHDRAADPRFCGLDDGDLTVRGASPCLPGNSDSCGPIGALGQGCGVVSVRDASWGGIKSLHRE